MVELSEIEPLTSTSASVATVQTRQILQGGVCQYVETDILVKHKTPEQYQIHLVHRVSGFRKVHQNQ